MTCLIIITGGISVALRVHQAWGEAFTCLPAIYDRASEENEEDPRLREIIHLTHVVSVQPWAVICLILPSDIGGNQSWVVVTGHYGKNLNSCFDLTPKAIFFTFISHGSVACGQVYRDLWSLSVVKADPQGRTTGPSFKRRFLGGKVVWVYG